MGKHVTLRPSEMAHVSVERVDGGIDPWTVTIWVPAPNSTWEKAKELKVKGNGLSFRVDGMPAFRVGVRVGGAPPLVAKVKMRVRNPLLDVQVPSFPERGPSPAEWARLLAEVEGLT